MNIVPTECCYPNCSAPLSTRVHEPLCDTHLVEVYRAVDELMKQANPSAPVTSALPRRERATITKATPGRIYFAQFGDRIKIGFSTNVNQRMGAVPNDKVLATMPGTQYHEKQLHRRFAALRITGEWFRPEPELLDYIAQVKASAA